MQTIVTNKKGLSGVADTVEKAINANTITIQFTPLQYQRLLDLMENGSPFMEGLAHNMKEQANNQPKETVWQLDKKIETVHSILSDWNNDGKYKNILEYLKPTEVV